MSTLALARPHLYFPRLIEQFQRIIVASDFEIAFPQEGEDVSMVYFCVWIVG